MEEKELKIEALRLASIGDREHPEYLKMAEARFRLFMKLLSAKNI